MMDIRWISMIAVLLAADAGNCHAMARFSSPASIDKLEKVPSIKVEKLLDHIDIKYPGIPAGGNIYRVTESRWEDGSAFSISKRDKVIMRLGEASSYWSYAARGGVHLYFVDDPREYSKTGRYDGLTYEYLFVEIDPQGRAVASDCQFAPHKSDNRVLKVAMNRRVNTDRLNPVPPLIADALSRDQHDRATDRCKAHNEP